MAPAAVISLSGGRGAGPALRLLGDRHLSRLASMGDARAFAAIYERHHQALYRYCRSITGNAEDASDALQSTMAAALRSLPGERREIALRPWLFKVAHNESVSLVRRRRPAAELDEESVSQAPGPHGLACMRERVGVLVDNLRDLPERQRGALVMRELTGLEYGEIGIALGISAPAARQAVYEARLALTEYQEGREMACDSARRSISARDGRMLRGRRLRAHLRGCRPCANFSEQVELRQSAMSSVFPPLPAAAGVAILAGLLGAGSVGVGTGASVGVAAGAGSSGIASIVAGGLSQAAGASGAAKSAAAVVAVAVAGVGTVEVAKEAVKDPAPSSRSSLSAAAPRAHSTAGAQTVRALAKAAPQRRTPLHIRHGDAGERRPADEGSAQSIDDVKAPARGPRQKRRAPAVEPVSAPPASVPMQAPAPAPRAPAATPPAVQPSVPAAPQPWQQQYADGVARYQAGMNLVQQTMQGVQQMMNGLFSGTQRR